MVITIISKNDNRYPASSASTPKITLSKTQTGPEEKKKFAALITSLPSQLNYKDLKNQIFKDFDATYQKVDDTVFLAFLKDKSEVMKFCAKYNLAEINNHQIKAMPIIKLEQESIFQVKLKK
ncbi:hypothetical protein SS50377_25382 [Spironucleus salmonicida]|uniref:Uncharacterized protein n=1 Tax=Spironucleus salmonicida TaxID=348837 RepID=V6LMJ1_9EUKA|nr:hypothetical protein SS50377_25382 [Spironucleus salmonicida]|eukprot:EST44926.1 Hypothetical protein SS50377_14944 [Spironucleus salmonicida]